MADEWYQRPDQPSALSAGYFQQPSPARMWNYLQGGADNYPLDRAAGDVLAETYPEIIPVARQSNACLARAVRFMAEHSGIQQFLDLGCGLPAPNDLHNVHEVAQAVHPGARVLYVDSDKVVMAHAAALLTSSTPTGRCDYLEADASDTEPILARAREIFDFDRPIGILMSGVLGHLADYRTAREVVRRFVEAVPVASQLLVRDGVAVSEPQRAGVARRNKTGMPPYQLRQPDEFLGYFDGLELVEPGIVPVNRWRPALTEVGIPHDVPSQVGVARKVAP